MQANTRAESSDLILPARTLMLTTTCTGGCVHCPFSHPALKQVSMRRDVFRKILADSKGEYLVLSGGEPFEHPRISEFLADLLSHSAPFRIATGGFIDLEPWGNELAALIHQNCGFQGISLGTDSLTSRCPEPRHAKKWAENLTLLNRLQIPYSITITLGADLSLTLLNDLLSLNCCPTFIYLRHRGLPQENLSSWQRGLREALPSLNILEDLILNEQTHLNQSLS